MCCASTSYGNHSCSKALPNSGSSKAPLQSFWSITTAKVHVEIHNPMERGRNPWRVLKEGKSRKTLFSLLLAEQSVYIPRRHSSPCPAPHQCLGSSRTALLFPAHRPKKAGRLHAETTVLANSVPVDTSAGELSPLQTKIFAVHPRISQVFPSTLVFLCRGVALTPTAALPGQEYGESYLSAAGVSMQSSFILCSIQY